MLPHPTMPTPSLPHVRSSVTSMTTRSRAPGARSGRRRSACRARRRTGRRRPPSSPRAAPPSPWCRGRDRPSRPRRRIVPMVRVLDVAGDQALRMLLDLGDRIAAAAHDPGEIGLPDEVGSLLEQAFEIGLAAPGAAIFPMMVVPAELEPLAGRPPCRSRQARRPIAAPFLSRRPRARPVAGPARRWSRCPVPCTSAPCRPHPHAAGRGRHGRSAQSCRGHRGAASASRDR